MKFRLFIETCCGWCQKAMRRPDERKLFCGSMAASVPCSIPYQEEINQRFPMKRNVLFGTMILLAGSLFAADASPKDEVKAAAKALGNQTNYSWKATVESPNGGGRFNGPTDGKTEQGGYTCLTMTRDDGTTEAVLKGDKGAVKTPDEGWQSLAELSKDNGDGGFNRSQFLARRLQAFKAPATEAVDLADKAKELKKDGDAWAGDLTVDGAKSLLTMGRPSTGDNAPTVTDPKGSVKFWVKDGQLAKYQYHVQGKVSFNGNDRDVDRTTTVQIKDVGTIKIQVSDAAKKKL
jgi:hypothetical protein